MGFGEQLYATEISESGVAAIKGKGISRLTECILFDGNLVPYSDKRFDIVIMSHVVEHLDNPRQLIREAARVGKYLFIEVPAEDTIRLPRDYVPSKVGHINFYSDKTIRQLVQSCGLRVIDQITTNPPKASYEFQAGYRGTLHFTIKSVCIWTLPALAKKVFCYHESLICAE